MVQRDQWDTYWGAKNIIFLIRDNDDATVAAASVESCQFVARRPPGTRLGSILDMCSRLRRMCGGFHRCIHISKFLCALLLYIYIFIYVYMHTYILEA